MQTLEELQKEAIESIELMNSSEMKQEMIERQIKLAYTIGRRSAFEEAQKLIAS